MRINNNIMAMNTQRQLGVNNQNVAKATERLSSGYRINRAGDDAAGLAISEKMRAQVKGLNMASKNSQDAISLIQTAEGALTETHSILQRMRELSVQSASDTNQTAVDREALQDEFAALISEIDDIAQDTAFNDRTLLTGALAKTIGTYGGTAYGNGADEIEGVAAEGDWSAANYTITFTEGDDTDYYNVTIDDGSGVNEVHTDMLVDDAMGTNAVTTLNFGEGRTLELTATSNVAGVAADALEDLTLTFVVADTGAQIQTGANEGQNLIINIGDMQSTAIGNDGVESTQFISAATIDTRTNAEAAIDTVNVAINEVSEQRSALGAVQNRLQHKINNLDTSAENLQAAESRIRDLDMAKEMTEFTKNNILVQAATSMLAQANAAPQGVLSLLQ